MILSTNQTQPNFETRILIASLLSAAAVFLYAPAMRHRQPVSAGTQGVSTQRQEVSPEAIQPYPLKLSSDESSLLLTSRWLSLSIGEHSAAILKVSIQGFKNHDGSNLSIGNSVPVFAFLDEQGASKWAIESRDQTSAIFTRSGEQGSERLSIRLRDEAPIADIALETGSNANHQTKTAFASWTKSDSLSGRGNLLELVLKTERAGPWQRQYLTYHEGVKTEHHVPRGTSIVTIAERHFCQSILPETAVLLEVTRIPSEHGTIAVLLRQSVTPAGGEYKTQKYELYFGPRDILRMKEVGFSGAFPLGVLGQLGILLVIMLKGIAGVVRNYGVAVIILAGFVNVLLSPFTLMSFRSMRKMKEIEPKLDQLKKKFSADPQRMNKETMALFKEHKVSPLGGCLPLMIQLPFFFALWSAISHLTELRGAKFLWITDLSLPDRLAKLPFGLDLNVLPILIATLMFLQSKISQKNTGPATGEMAILSGPLMSVMFGVMFYQVPSSLALYWATNSLVSIGVWRIAGAQPSASSVSADRRT